MSACFNFCSVITVYIYIYQYYYSPSAEPTSLQDLNISTVRPKDPTHSVYSKRLETYKQYPTTSAVKADNLCNAGFLYEGIKDRVKCFWCDGALETWGKGDDPWVEHAK